MFKLVIIDVARVQPIKLQYSFSQTFLHVHENPYSFYKSCATLLSKTDFKAESMKLKKSRRFKITAQRHSLKAKSQKQLKN